MIRAVLFAGVMCLVVGPTQGGAQTVRAVPRPPAQPPGPARPEDGSAAPDGYAPTPAWPGQTRAAGAAQTAYEVETVAEGLAGAFCFSFLPDGRMIVGERPGRIRIVAKNGTVSEPIDGMPVDMWARGSQGLFEVRPDKAFAANRRIYLTYTVLPQGADAARLPRSPGVLVAASARLSSDDRRLENLKVLLNAEGTGGRLVQGPDGTLFITSTIPAGIGINSVDWPQPQQLDSNMGKVLRINTDGSIPKDNPFVGRSGAHPEIYAIGFRDVQGVAIHPRTGRLWTSEHGPRGGDEINAVEKGRNYGFPVIGYGREYSGKPINGDKTAQDGMEQPVYFWTPDVAPAGIGFYFGRLFPAWQGDLFVSALAGRALVRLVMKDDRVVGEQRLLTDLNARIRGVSEGPEGALYVLTDGNAGKILRLVPKKEGAVAAPEHVSFPTGDGGIVYADVYGSGDRGIVLAHGGRFTRESWAPQAQELVKAGFRILAIDFRGYGQSRGGTRTPKNDDGYRFDVLAAVRYLRQTGAHSISVVGASFGGDAAAEASIAAAPREIDRIVLLAHGGYAPPERMQGRKLFIVARDDANDAGPRLPGIRKQYEGTPGPKELVILDGSAHAQFVFETDQGPRLMREILRFLTAP